jgi:hypothetical protein
VEATEEHGAGGGQGEARVATGQPATLPPSNAASIPSEFKTGDGRRRRYLAWIESAKREETKLRRLKEAIRLLARRKVLGLK